MKTLLKLKTPIAFAAVLTVLSACGSSGGGDRFEGPNTLLETEFRVIQPQRDSVLGTRGPVIVEVSDKSEFCNNPDRITDFIRVTLASEQNPNNPTFPISFGAVLADTGSTTDTCEITVFLSSNLLPGANYVLYRTENTSGSTSFTTTNGIPFTASEDLSSFNIIEALSEGFSVLDNADLFLGSGGQDNIDEDAFLDWLIESATSSLFNQFLGGGVQQNAVLKAGFDEPVQASDLAAKTYVYEFNGTLGNIIDLLQSGDLQLDDFQLLEGAGGVGCDGPGGACVYLDADYNGHIINFEGPWQPGKSYMIIVSENLLSVNLSQLNTTYYRLFSVQ